MHCGKIMLKNPKDILLCYSQTYLYIIFMHYIQYIYIYIAKLLRGTLKALYYVSKATIGQIIRSRPIYNHYLMCIYYQIGPSEKVAMGTPCTRI